MDILAVKDYPRARYSAYWEIAIDRKTFGWLARLYDFATSAVLKEQAGAAPDMDAARSASQAWVKAQMDDYARPGPLAA